MKRLVMALTLSSFCLLSGLAPQSVWAGAWEQLQQIGGPPPDVPMPSAPTPVEPQPDNSSYQNNNTSYQDNSSYNSSSSDNNSSSSGYSGSSSNSGNSGSGRVLWGLFDPPTPEELERQRIAREQRRKRRKEAAERRRQQRAERQREEKRRERKKQQQEEEAGKVPWPKDLPKPRPVSPSTQRTQPTIIQVPTSNVPPGTEAKTLRDYLLRIAILRKKSPLSALEQSLLNELENAARELWIKASAVAGLTPEERTKLVMSIPTAVTDVCKSIGTLTRDTLASWKRKLDENKVPEDDPMVRFNTDKTVALVEYEGNEFAEKVLPEEIAEKYDVMLGAGKIGIALRKGDRPEAVSEFIDLLVGKIGIPQASWAVEGGRMYADFGFKTLDRFMKDAMAAVGVDFDTKEFWKQFHDDLTFGQKCVYKWIGGPDVE